ncbi:rRNA maturation RNase YbeY [Campylobacter sp. faydin G-140]|uniref:rRNA maturation RNase YbeY n=1 Tax=Campylobacter anatolicus TaxID=2829105 RepID=UPI001B9F7145|nr:rRNA maturation RNase YbeY [Campylobacter anatolicus]MBR8465668.1 rRNA maturation RNase YbeY [Campylobacter anatolicus]
MIICDDKYPKILDKICEFLTPGDVELSFVNSNQMREINLRERGIDKTTDVLSFPFEFVMHTPLGCIVINLELVSQKATELGHSDSDEVALLFTHGLLHVLGYDHEKDDGQMREKECEVIENFNLPKSLIVRTEES